MEDTNYQDTTTAEIKAVSRRGPSLDLLEELAVLFTDRLSTNKAVCLAHGADESAYQPIPPDAVVYPNSTEEVAALVRLCNQYRCPLIPFGVGSSVEGHVLAVDGGISVDMTRMDKVLSVDVEDFTATVQAGVTREGLNRALAGSGFFFSVDPGADATIGGMVATGASGTNTVRYGTMRENLVAMKVVASDGALIKTSNRARKTSAGYNLTQLFAGSEGTLGIITEITVKLHPMPEAVAAAVLSFPTARQAVASVIQAMQMGVPLARAEMLDAVTVRAVNAHSHTGFEEVPTLFLEFCGSNAQIEEQALIVKELAQEQGARTFDWAWRPEERTRLWKPRHHAYFAALQLRPGSRSFTTDACVPLSKLADCLQETMQDIDEAGMIAPIFGHVGDGNFHCLLLANPEIPEELARAEELSARIARRAMRLGGTCTGEHGVGLHKIPYLVEEHGPEAVSIMRKIKSALDPHNILNPGKVVLTKCAASPVLQSGEG